jgi:hypothetical protein
MNINVNIDSSVANDQIWCKIYVKFNMNWMPSRKFNIFWEFHSLDAFLNCFWSEFNAKIKFNANS